MSRASGQVPRARILHVDMDAFYTSVETLRRPELAGRPVLVGGAGGRGVVASASYEARRFGVASATPMARALRLCPDAVVVPPDFARYQAVSRQLGELLHSVTPLVEPLSIDEAFLDVGGSVRLFGEASVIGQRLRERIRAELGLPASVGVAPNKFLAKLCSGKAKPDGLLHLEAADVEAFLATLAVRELWGVGAQTAAKLERFGIRTVTDVAAAPADTLVRLLGPAAAAHLAQLARGDDPRPVTPHEPAKGMSAEETFERDVDDPAVLRRVLLGLAERVGRRLRADGVAARTVTLKLRYATFQTITRSQTLDVPTDQTTEIHREAGRLLTDLRLERVRVRLLGIGTTGLVPADGARQLRLLDLDTAAFAGDPERWRELEHAADAVRDRFGDAAVTRGALLDDENTDRRPPPPSRDGPGQRGGLQDGPA